MVGTPDRSLDQIQEIERRTQLNYTRLAQVFGYIAGILLLGVAIGFVVGYLYLSYARNMVDMVNTAGDDPTPVSQEQTQAE